MRDEEQIVIPGTAQSEALSTAPGTLININRALEEELDLLPGIGEAYSRRIVDSRTVDGPFETIEELVERGVVPAATSEKIRELIVVEPWQYCC